MSERCKATELLERNRKWAARIHAKDPSFFDKLSQQQAPRYLWIGCSDSRVPSTEIVDLMPGEMFVHRNIANQVIHSDLNCLSVLQFAVDALKVEHIIVCGHYGCGGVEAALAGKRLGLSDNWLRHVQDVYLRHRESLPADRRAAIARLCELNVIEQAANVCRTGVVQDAWARGQELEVHGWIYSISDGLLQDLGVDIAAAETVEPACLAAIGRLGDGN